MANANTNSAKAEQNINNDIIQSSRQSCTATCTNVFSNNTIVISGTTIGGNLSFSQSCTASASCIMTQTLDTNVENILKSTLSQTAEAPAMNFNANANTNISDIRQSIKNTIQQTMISSCNASIVNLNSGNFIFLANSSVGGDVSFTQSGDAIANCSMENTAKTILTNKATSDIKQTAKTNDIFGGAFGFIIALVAVLIVVYLAFRYQKSGVIQAAPIPTPKTVSKKNKTPVTKKSLPITPVTKKSLPITPVTKKSLPITPKTPVTKKLH